MFTLIRCVNRFISGLKRKMPTSDLMKTPKQSQELNPLDDKRVSLVSVIPLTLVLLQIYDEYACNIASELREERKKRRRTAPIPFNINLLDETEEDEEWRVTSMSLLLSLHCHSLSCTILYKARPLSSNQDLNHTMIPCMPNFAAFNLFHFP